MKKKKKKKPRNENEAFLNSHTHTNDYWKHKTTSYLQSDLFACLLTNQFFLFFFVKVMFENERQYTIREEKCVREHQRGNAVH